MKLKVAVMFGGESVEHEISIISASQAIENLDKEKYEIIPIYISKQREFYVGEALNDIANFVNLDNLISKCTQVSLIKKKGKVYIEPVNKGLFSKTINTIDVVMPIVHGTNGEDGSLQGFLEMLKVPYTGCSTIPAGVGQDKIFMKSILAHHNLPLAKWTWIYADEYDKNPTNVLAKVNELGYPVILKPACLGSSIGIEIAHNEEELVKAIEETSKYDFKIIIEKLITNFKEVNCSVRGTHFNPKASELELTNETKDGKILDFQEKYLPQGNKLGKGKTPNKVGYKKTGPSKGMASAARLVPAPISDEQTNKIKELALKTFEVLQASGVCRIDFMLNSDNDDIYITEINTIPGSLAYYLWTPLGVSFTQLLDDMINDALDLDRRKNKMTFSFDTNVLASYAKK